MDNNQPRTLVELLSRAVSKWPDKEVLRFKQDKRWTGITGSQLAERVRNVALGLKDLGVRKGDPVAMLAESGPLWSITDYAILSNGAVNVPIYPTQPANQVEYILRDSSPRVMFISTERQMKRVDTALKKFPGMRLVSFASKAGDGTIIPLTELEARGSAIFREQPSAYEELVSEVEPDDLASIIYTSGTTGEPKGAMLTHRNITFNALASGLFLGIEEGGVMLSYLPLSHIFERMVLYLCLYCGVQINYAGGIETVAADMKDVRPTLMSTVPRLLEKVYDRMQKNAADQGDLKKKILDWSLSVGRRWGRLSAEGQAIPPLLQLRHRIADRLVLGKLREAVGGRIQRLVSGGAALPSDVALIFCGASIPVLQGYGLTETSPVIAVNTLESNRIGAVGRTLPGVELKIAEDGEILTRGPHVFQGYFNKREETEAAFEPEPGSKPWFKTGDIGKLDSEGFLFITDRKKDLIKTSAGKYVAPQSIERLLGQSEYIEQAVIVGDKRKYVAALIVPHFENLKRWARSEGVNADDNRRLTEERKTVELIKGEVNKLTRDLADYEKVKRIALVPDEFTIEGGELTPTLKVKRRVIEQKYAPLIESMYDGGADKGVEARASNHGVG